MDHIDANAGDGHPKGPMDYTAFSVVDMSGPIHGTGWPQAELSDGITSRRLDLRKTSSITLPALNRCDLSILLSVVARGGAGLPQILSAQVQGRPVVFSRRSVVETCLYSVDVSLRQPEPTVDVVFGPSRPTDVEAIIESIHLTQIGVLGWKTGAALQRLRSLEAEKAALISELVNERSRHEGAQREAADALAAIRASSSWRMTAPLRALGRRLKVERRQK